jgi:hypothetical protein
VKTSSSPAATTLYNEDLAIVKMQPPVNKEDFGGLKTALRTFFHDIH